MPVCRRTKTHAAVAFAGTGLYPCPALFADVTHAGQINVTTIPLPQL